MNKPLPINDSNFQETVLQADKPVLVDFWAPWCGPCQMVAPVLEELAEEYNGKIGFVKLNVDENPKTATKYGIMAIPSLLIFKKGQPVSHIVGFRPKQELKRTLEGVIG